MARTRNWRISAVGARGRSGFVPLCIPEGQLVSPAYLHQQGLDTSTPARLRAMLVLGLIAEFERAMIRDRVLSGLARARAEGTKSGRAIGRPAITPDTREAVRVALSAGESERAIARRLGIGKGTAGRVRVGLPDGG